MLVYQRVNLHFPYGFPMVFPLKPPFSYGIPMVLPEGSGFFIYKSSFYGLAKLGQGQGQSEDLQLQPPGRPWAPWVKKM